MKNIFLAIKNRLHRLTIRDREFTIVSNNCWGAHIYQNLDEPYRTPFVGLFLAPDCYLRLLGRFRWYIEQPLTFLAGSRHGWINELREKQGLKYPIGLLGNDVEIQFLHYSSEDEATEKWARRVKRIVTDDQRLFVKFCDRDSCTDDHLALFDRLPFANKVCFVAQPRPKLASTVWIPDCEGDCVPDGLILSRISPKYFDVAGWINGKQKNIIR